MSENKQTMQVVEAAIASDQEAKFTNADQIVGAKDAEQAENMKEKASNITRLEIDGKEIIIIGTAHVSKHSAQEVKTTIEAERPDSVAIELDADRYESIRDKDKWRNMDIFKLIKEKKATLLLMNLAISSFQKKIAQQFGIESGQEMLQAIDSAEEIGAEIVLADRNIQTTFARIWSNIGWKGKFGLLVQVLAGIFSDETITEEELEEMKSQDMIESILQEFSQAFPRLKTPLIDERDQYLAQKIKESPGQKVVAVVGAAHVPGILVHIENDQDLEVLDARPPKSKAPVIIGWAIPVIIIGAILYTFLSNPSAGIQQTISWVLWNGSLSAIGAALAMGHPLAILTAFVASPITSLNPMLAAGWFAGFTQAYIRRPNVGDFENLTEDVFTVKGFWQNKVTRVLLVIVFANLGSSLGTFIGGADVLRLFIENL